MVCLFARSPAYGKITSTQIRYCVLFGAAAFRLGKAKVFLPSPP